MKRSTTAVRTTRPQPRSHRIEPLWDRVDRNRIELMVFVLCFLAVSAIGTLIVGAFALLGLVIAVRDPELVEFLVVQGGRFAPLAAAGSMLIAGAYVAVALSRSERWLLARFGATLAPRGELLPTKHALKDMAIAAGYDVAPALYVLETRNVNAFVFGKGERRPVVGVTRGLVERLTPDEQRAVFANLMARLRAGDTIWATGVTAIMAPLWTIRDHQMTSDDDLGQPTRAARVTDPITGHTYVTRTDADLLAGVFWLMPMLFAFVFVSEFVAFGHRWSQLRHAEVADAEGMLLLKDPRSMLKALEKCVRFNNYVPTAGPGFTQLFYLWTGDSSTDDEDDPEYRRITRLREVLGVEGLSAPEVAPNAPVMAPPAPRLES
ncbi:MAG: M48 family metalloprotease [Coriobacteriia bacterium]|nr:M48 family metalloprotease [Coriobacteriia bacterium]